MRFSIPFTLRLVLRGLNRQPAFTAAAVLTLALGIGLNTAVFSAMNAVLLRPLPYHAADRLLVLEETRRESPISVAYPNLLDWRARSRTMSSIAGFAGSSRNVTGGGDPERIRAHLVTANLFGTLGVAPALGRGFSEAEDQPGSAPLVIIGHGLWQRRFGGNPSAIGGTILLDDIPHTIVGVMPRGFDFPGGIVYGAAEAWLPAGLAPAEWQNRDSHPGIVAIGRLADGQSVEAAQAELAAVAGQLRQEYPASNDQQSAIATPALRHLVGDSQGMLLLLFGAAALVLLIATANVANLLLVRATGRRRELVIRTALGADRRHLAMELAVESLLLTGAGTVVGLLAAAAATRLAGPLLAGLPRQGVTVFDWRVLTFAVVASLGAALLVGVLPLLAQRDGAAFEALRSRASAAGAARTRDWIVSAEAALALMLLVGAGLMSRSMTLLVRDHGGIDPEGVVSWEVSLPEARYPTPETQDRFHQALLEAIAEHPGVLAAGGITTLPFSGAGAQSRISVPGTELEPVRTDVSRVTPGYFAAMGVAVQRGRVFTEGDREGTPIVGIVDERFAEQVWPGQDPIGKLLAGWGYEEITVVGVVSHVKNYGVQAESRGELYLAVAQRPVSRLIGVARTTGDPAALAPAIRGAVATLDPLLPVVNLRTMADVVGQTTATTRLSALLGGVFALLALALALVGLYGVLAHGVALRTREIGVRLALGAEPRQVLGMVVGNAIKLVAVGLAAGLLGALGLARLLQGMLYGVAPWDLATFALAPVAFLLTAVAAALLPARRAARVSPMETLREEG